VADGGGARPESTRERGMPVAGGSGPGVGNGGESRALERRSRSVVGMGGRVDAVTLERHGRRRSREGKKREGEKVGVPHGTGGAVGPGLDWRASPGSGPSVALAGDVRRVRACRPDRAGREGADRWAAAQCRAVVPLTGGAGLSAGAVESAGARGPAREESGVAEPR
jgi:hypothetical protein